MALDLSYVRTRLLPTIYCPGCGHGVVTQAFIRAIKAEGWDKDEIIAVSGIGCSARTPSYPDVNGIQTTHGRALAYATGIKMTRPEKHVVLFLGDGDCAAIGGNHFLHACRRNIDMTVIVMNNSIYGMTGGQVSPTTPHNSFSTTTQYGNIDKALDVCKLAEAAGATFVARSTAYHAAQLDGLFRKAFANHGLSVVEVVCPCPTNYGRRNNFKQVGDMYDYLKDNTVPMEKWKTLTEEERAGKIQVGIFVNSPEDEYLDKYNQMVASIKAKPEAESIDIREVPGEKVERYECRFAGFGGQGLISAGIILSDAMIRQGKLAVQTQSYGPEARGGSSKSEVVISDYEISFPEVSSPDMYVALTEEAYNKYLTEVKPNSIIIADTTYFKPDPPEGCKLVALPISEICTAEIGDVRTANIYSLGLIAGLVDFIDYDCLKDAVLARMAPKIHAINMKALEAGLTKGRAFKYNN